MVSIITILLLFWVMANDAVAAIRYVSLSGSDAVTCAASEDIATPKRTLVSAVSCLQPGDTLYIRGGTWAGTDRVDITGQSKSGTADGWITIAGYPGETVVLQYSGTGTNGVINARGNRGYFIFENLVIDGTNTVDTTEWAIRDGNHDFILRNIELKNIKSNGLSIIGNNVTVSNCHIHDLIAHPTSRRYIIYLRSGSNVLIENSNMHDAPGGGIHVYSVTGEATPGTIIRGNTIHHNNVMDTSPVSGIHLFNESGTISDIQIYDNVIYENGLLNNRATPPGGITVSTGVVRAKIWNNTIYGNHGYGVNIQSGTNGPPIDTVVQNNIIVANIDGQTINAGTNTTMTFNACLSGDSCGTSKVTLSTAAACLADQANDDYRLKQGTNPCRDSGTATSARPSPVGPPDVGAYEQGVLSAAVVNDGIDLTLSVMTPGVLPTTAIITPTVTCVGCSGSPVASAAAVRVGASNIVHLVISGIASPGTCNVSIGTTNMTDSLFIGGTSGTAQGINSSSNFSVIGTCGNSVGGSPPAGDILHYKMDEGSGTSLNDETVNNNDGVLSGAPTWGTGIQDGSGLYFPNDAVDRRVTTPYGNAISLASQSLTLCVSVKADTGIVNKIIAGPNNGASQRFYFGTYTGQTWGLGVGASAYSTGGESEFPVTANRTRICLHNNAATDIATLVVNGVKGTSSNAVKSSAGVTLAGNFLLGCGFLTTTYCGGYAVDELKIWDYALSDAELLEDYESYVTPGAAVTCYDQANHQVQYTHLVGGNPVNYKGEGDAIVDIIDGGAAMVVVQFDCTGSDGTSISVVPYYSTSVGGTFDLPVPSTLGVGGVAVYGASTDSLLNAGTVSGNLSGALGNVAGSTVLMFGASPTITLSQDESQVMRWGFRFARGLTDQYRCIKFKQDNGTDLAGGYTPTDGICFHFTNVKSGIR